ncbi:MAG: TonB family protein [Candidatus Omnitrophica bacterium]|nr:TonB family protein [Candidatus Omnitrophota bacterium]
MKSNLTVTMMKKFICLLLAVCLLPVYVPSVHASTVNAFEEVQLLKGDVYTIPAKGLQRVSVTDPNIADISDAKPDKVIVVGSQPGQTVLFLWDESGKRSFIIQVINEDLGLIKARIKTILDNSDVKGVTISQNDLEGKVMLTGAIPEDKVETVAQVADTFPGSVLNLVRKEQIDDLVQIDVQITELSTTLTKAMGVDWADGGGSTTGTFLAPVVAEQNIPQGKFLDTLQIGKLARTTTIQATVNAMITEGRAKILSKPRLVVKSGKEASFLVGGEVPINTVTTNAATGNGTITQNVTYKSYGVTVAMTPSIKEGKVDVLVNMEISDIDGAKQSGNNTAFLTRTAQTQLLLDDKQTIVLAGLIRKTRNQQDQRVPFLGKIPIIGWFFSSRKTVTPDDDTEVVISLTPTILKASKRVDVVDQPVVNRQPAPVAAPVVKADDKLVMDAGRNGNKLPVIAKNAANVPVTISENLKPYAQAVQQKVSSAIAYPYEAQENRWQGTVKLGLVIRKDGSLRDAFVKESSGYDVFDQDAVNTAQILAPYDRFPANISQDEITVTLPIVYSLDSFLKNVAKHK